MRQEFLSICLFGSHLFRCEGRPYRLGIRGKTLDLLRYLVVNAGSEFRRECIADQFWHRSSHSRQRSALNSAIWRIGKKLPDTSAISFHVNGSTICLAINDQVPVDTQVLTELVQSGSEPDGMNCQLVENLSAALDASETPFLDGLAGDWALSEQERIFNIRIRGLTLLMHWYGDARRYEDALEAGRRLLIADPFREAAQIDMMWLYVLNSQRAQALKSYQQYAQLLERELDIEPMIETRALYDYIRCGLNCGAQAQIGTFTKPVEHTGQKQKLDKLLSAIEHSRRELYHAFRAQAS